MVGCSVSDLVSKSLKVTHLNFRRQIRRHNIFKQHITRRRLAGIQTRGGWIHIFNFVWYIVCCWNRIIRFIVATLPLNSLPSIPLWRCFCFPLMPGSLSSLPGNKLSWYVLVSRLVKHFVVELNLQNHKPNCRLVCLSVCVLLQTLTISYTCIIILWKFLV